MIHANARLKGSYWAEEFHGYHRIYDLDHVQEQRRLRGDDTFETDPPRARDERRARGDRHARVNQVALSMVQNRIVIEDVRSNEERTVGAPLRGHAIEYRKPRCLLVVSFTDIMGDYTSIKWPASPARILPFR